MRPASPLPILRPALIGGLSLMLLASCGGGGTSAPAADPVVPAQPAAETGLRFLAGSVNQRVDFETVMRDAFVRPADIIAAPNGGFYLADAGKIMQVSAAGAVSRAATLPCFFARGLALDGAGNVYTTCGNVIYKMSPSGQVAVVAGKPEAYGYADGKASEARFRQLNGVAVDGVGNIYVSDIGNVRLRKITVDGQVSTLAGNGRLPYGPGAIGPVDGKGTAAGFASPGRLAVDAQGNVLMLDGQALRVIAPDGAVTTRAGSPIHFESVDGMGADAGLARPTGLQLDPDGNAWIVEADSPKIRRISPLGQVVTVVADAGKGSGGLLGLARTASGNFVALDDNQAKPTLRMVNSAGLVTAFASTVSAPSLSPAIAGQADGTGAQARFSWPGAMASDGKGSVYVLDNIGQALRKVSASGAVTTVALPTVAMPAGQPARSYSAFAVDGSGSVYLIPEDDRSLFKLTASGLAPVTIELPANVSDAVGFYPVKISSGPDGSIYAAIYVTRRTAEDCTLPRTGCGFAHEMMVVRIAADGSQSVLALGPQMGASAVHIAYPVTAMTVDRSGNVYLAATSFLVRVPASGNATIVAGDPNGTGLDDGAGSGARFVGMYSMAADAAGNIYVDDYDNLIVRRITPDGVVTTLAGAFDMKELVLGSWTGSLSKVRGLAIDANGKLVLSVEHGLVTLQLP